jgi:hypothetical protein
VAESIEIIVRWCFVWMSFGVRVLEESEREKERLRVTARAKVLVCVS